MARFLAIDWDHGQLRVVLANVKHGAVHIQRAIAWPEERGPNPAEAELQGQRLKERLKSVGIGPAPVLACLGRDRVILKEIRHPAVPPAEEPALVRFQAVKELNDAPGDVVIDYVPAGELGRERRALALVLRRELAQTYQTLCRSAGLKLAGLCPRPFGTAACVAPHAATEAVAVLTIADRWAEFNIVQGGRLLLARSLAVPQDDAELLGEVRRNLAVYAGQNPQQPVRSLFVSDERLADRLRPQLAIPVQTLDPFAGLSCDAVLPDPRGPFAGVVGVLRAWAAAQALPINFVQPRQPKQARDVGAIRVAVAGIVAFTLLVSLAFAAFAHLSSKDAEVRELTRQRLLLDGQLTRIEEDAARIKALSEWHDGSVVWLDELYDLTHRVPDVNSLRVTQLTAELTSGSSRTGKDKSKDKLVGKMVLRGVSSDKAGAVDNLVAQMVRDGGYRVGASQWSQNQMGLERLRFNQQFTTPVELERRPPEKYERQLPPPKPPERRPKGFFKGPPAEAPPGPDMGEEQP